MRIALIGGHGKVALLATPLLVAAGHDVGAIIRNPDHGLDVEAAGAAPVVADIENLDSTGFASVLSGYDTVIWSAGAGEGTPPARTRWIATRRSPAWTPPSPAEWPAT